jgi:hypothetical protein
MSARDGYLHQSPRAFPSTRRLCSIPENAPFDPQSDGASPGP